MDHLTLFATGLSETSLWQREDKVSQFKIAIRPYQPGDAPLLYEAARESIADISPWLPWCHPGINQLHPVHQFANLGYWVRSSCTGHGIAVAAVRLCAQFGFAELHLKRLEILTAAGNVRSQRVAEKAGATREGVLRQRLNIGDVWHDAVLFSLLPADLAAAGA